MPGTPISPPKPWNLPYEVRFKDRLPRVMLGFIAFGDIAPEAFESTVAWAFQAGQRYKGRYEILFQTAYRREQYRARNGLCRNAQESGCDFLLMVDDDHTLFDCPGIIDHFFEERKPLQGGLYVQRRQDICQPVLMTHDPETGLCKWATWNEVPMNGGPVDVLGGGVNWLDVSILDFIQEPFWWPYPIDYNDGRAVKNVTFYPQMKYGLDLQLCLAAKRVGVQPWLNGKVKVGHVVNYRSVLRPPGMQPTHEVCYECDTPAPWDYVEERYVCPTCAKTW